MDLKSRLLEALPTSAQAASAAIIGLGLTETMSSSSKVTQAKVKKRGETHLLQAPKFIYGRRKKNPFFEQRLGVEQLGRPCSKPPDLSNGVLIA
jgi:hypothetical protein